jgi:DNA-binding NtrC family response regulator
MSLEKKMLTELPNNESRGKGMKLAAKKILVVEDDTSIQQLLSGFFTSKGYEVSCFKEAEVALSELQNAAKDYGVIVTDFMLPQMTGLELIEKIKGMNMNLPVILITGHKKVNLAAEAVQAGAYCFVQKPICFPELLISVDRAMQFLKVSEENTILKTAVQMQSGATCIEGIVGKSPGIRKALDLAKRVSRSTANVLITGESGTGKEVIAKAVHNLGPRRKAPFVAINCCAIPENLLESELFGHSKGAFTGAIDKKVGLFEEAEGGTLFLDEIGDLSLPLQAKLLRVLQERKIKRIGENQWRSIDVRIVSATHRDLRKEILEERFREDLFFRLNVIPITIPPLRERQEDIIPLAEYFLKRLAAVNYSRALRFSKEALESLLKNPWTGNVRELENTVERAVVLTDSEVIQAHEIVVPEQNSQRMPPSGMFDFIKVSGSRILTVEELTELYVNYILTLNDGAKSKTAKDLGIDRKTLSRKLHHVDIQSRNEARSGEVRSLENSFN